MGLVKTRRLAAMQKQTSYAKATEVRQKAKLKLAPNSFPRKAGKNDFNNERSTR